MQAKNTTWFLLAVPLLVSSATFTSKVKKLIVRFLLFTGRSTKFETFESKFYLAKGVCSTWYTEVMGSVRMRLRSRSSGSSSSPSLAVLKSALLKPLKTLIFKTCRRLPTESKRRLQLQSVTKRSTIVLKINVYTYLCEKWH